MQTITATFEDGVLKPKEPLDLPAHAQVRNVRRTRARGSSGRLTMSDRNGVEAMLHVTPSRSISGTASAADHASSATVVVPSMTGISMP